jgi:pyridoxine 5-phosphate synthase
LSKLRLYVNVDHVATVRQARRANEPDPVEAGLVCERAGADGVTVHLREDRRHIQDEDVRRLAANAGTVVNLELAAVDAIVDVATGLRPRLHQVTFVPERREEITTEGGLDLRAGPALERLRKAVRKTTDAGIRVSLFIDPDADAVERAVDLGVAAIEFHTGEYAHAFPDAGGAIDRLRQACTLARSRGLAVHAGHGLTYRNVQPVAAIAQIEELNIGHSVVSHSIFAGLDAAVREMRRLVDAAR